MENQNNPFETEQEQTPQGGGGYAAAARPARRGLYTIICVLALLTVAAVLMRSQAFRVYDHTEVIGLSSFSRDDVMRLAGITRGTTYFGIDEEAIRKGINSNRYLDYEGLEKIWPNMLILMVKERTPCVNFLYRGVQYTLADDTTVLESSTNINLDNGCIKLTLANVRDIRVGEKVLFQSERQSEALQGLLAELEIQGVLGKTAELNLYDLENIYLVTMDGYTANLGNADALRAKIGTVRAVVQELRRRGYQGGMIEAGVPGQASYRPAE